MVVLLLQLLIVLVALSRLKLGQSDLFGQLQKVDSVLRMTHHNLFTFNVRKVIFQDVFREEVNQCLDIFRLLLLVLRLLQQRKVDVGEGVLKELDVEGVLEEHFVVVDSFFNA